MPFLRFYHNINEVLVSAEIVFVETDIPGSLVIEVMVSAAALISKFPPHFRLTFSFVILPSGLPIRRK